MISGTIAAEKVILKKTDRIAHRKSGAIVAVVEAFLEAVQKSV